MPGPAFAYDVMQLPKYGFKKQLPAQLDRCCEASRSAVQASGCKHHHALERVTCLEASIEQIKGSSRAFFIDHQLEPQANAMATEDSEDARRKPVVPPMEFAASLLLIHSFTVSSKGGQPSQEGKGGHVHMGGFGVWDGCTVHNWQLRALTSVQRSGIRALARSAFRRGKNSEGMRCHSQLRTTSNSDGKPAARASLRATPMILSWPLRSRLNSSAAYRDPSMPEVG